MLGVEAAKDAVATILEEHLPAKCAELEARLSLPPDTIRAPVLYATWDRDSLDEDEYPAVIVASNDLPSLERVDINDGEGEYAVRYRMQVYVECLTREHNDYEGATRLRDRLELGVREILLQRQKLSTAHYVAEETTFTVSYSDLGRDTQDRVLAAFSLECDVIASEILDLTPLAVPPLTVPLTVPRLAPPPA